MLMSFEQQFLELRKVELILWGPNNRVCAFSHEPGEMVGR
jgi:hypothetical protein